MLGVDSVSVGRTVAVGRAGDAVPGDADAARRGAVGAVLAAVGEPLEQDHRQRQRLPRRSRHRRAVDVDRDRMRRDLLHRLEQRADQRPQVYRAPPGVGEQLVHVHHRQQPPLDGRGERVGVARGRPHRADEA